MLHSVTRSCRMGCFRIPCRKLPRISSQSLGRMHLIQRRPCSSNGGGIVGEKLLKDLSMLADNDPRALSRVGKSLSCRTLKKLRVVIRSEEKAIEEAMTAPQRPSKKQLFWVFMAPMPLFIVFGIMDNAIMILCGNYFDYTLGVMFGISTMAAAALGNLVSDVIGLGAGGYFEALFDKYGFAKDPKLTRAQEGMSVVRRCRFLGNSIGVAIGCLIGMFPLLFYDFDVIAKLKRQSKIDHLFVTVVEFVSSALQVESSSLYVVDREREELWTMASYSSTSKLDDAEKQFDLTKVRIPLNKGAAGHCAVSGDVINTNDREQLQRYGSQSHLVTGKKNQGVLCTPIFGKSGDIIGVLQVTNKNSGKPFSVRDEMALTAMSSHISCALEKVFLDSDDDGSQESNLLDALKTSLEHHTHHLRYVTSRSGGTLKLSGSDDDDD